MLSLLSKSISPKNFISIAIIKKEVRMIKRLLLLLLLFTGIALPQGWTLISTVPTSPAINSIAVVNENIIWVACAGSKVYLSEDGGLSWTLRNTGIPAATDLYGISAIDNMNCWVGTVAGSIYRTSDGGNSWTLQIAVAGSFMDGIKMFDVNNGVYYADPTGSGQPYQFRYTTDGGTNWTIAPNSPIAGSEFGVINAWDWLDQNTFWIGSANTTANATTAKIYYTTTGFAGTWNSATVAGVGGTQGLYYQAIGFTDAMHGMAGSNGSNIVKTTDGGVTWQPANIPTSISAFAAINFNGLKDGSNTYWLVLSESTTSYRMFKTTDQGNTYTEETLPPAAVTNGVQHMVFLNNNLGFAGGGAGVFLKYTGIVPVELTSFTANSLSGKIVLNWRTATETNNRGFEIERRIIKGDNTGTWNFIGFKSGNGTTTNPQEYSYTDNISDINATSIAYRLKQVDFDGRSNYSDEVLVENIVPVQFSLSQNYPNPFNPTTVINYALPYNTFVSLKVYNALGQEVSTLVNETKQAGSHHVNFNASGLPSGVYYYILKAGINNNFVQSDKMILMK
jgi:photosystem II stability/assembly factor-like uncharacterized protein